MKRLTTKIITIAACAAMMLSVPFVNTQTVQAAVKAQGTVNLATKKLSIPKGTSTVIKNNTLTMVKGRRYAVKFKINGKAYSLATLPASVGKAKVNNTATASIKSNLLTANKAGTTNLRVIKNGKDLVKLKVKVIDTTAHKHAWKNIAKATCATKGKKLCKTCGATGTTAMSKTHSFKVTKKATCERKGVETCTVCGLQNTLPKTAHKYVTETAKYPEGRGKKWNAYTVWCPGCMWDMTDWTKGQRESHQHHLDAVREGKLDIGCFNSGFTGVAGELRYEKYMLNEITETYCEYCGGGEDAKKTRKDLYYCDMYGKKLPDGETDPWAQWSYESYLKEHGFMVCPNCHDMEVMPGHTCQVCKTVAPASTAKKAAARKAVAAPQDMITDIPDNNTVTEDPNLTVSGDETLAENIAGENIVSENEAVSGNAVSENTISENETISGNTVSNNELNTEITDPNQGGDSVFGDSDDSGIVIENTDGDDDGIVIEEVDDADEEDNGSDDYDDSEGIVIEDE